MSIQHIWFDFSETIAHVGSDEHNKLKYAAYGEVVGRPVDDALKAEFDQRHRQGSHSISHLFYSLGKPAGWWSARLAEVDPAKLFHLIQDDTAEVLLKIKDHVSISIFSNIDLQRALPTLGIDPGMFEHIISSGMVNRPKPALDGFYKIIELSNLSPDQILYIGDHVAKDILPAKEVGLQTGLIWGKSDQADYCFDSFDEVLRLVERVHI